MEKPGPRSTTHNKTSYEMACAQEIHSRLQSGRPATRVPKVFWKVLSRGLWSGKCSLCSGKSGGARGNALEGALEGALPVTPHRKSPLRSTRWSTPDFPVHAWEHFPDHNPLESTFQSTSRDFPMSTLLIGRLGSRLVVTPEIPSHV